ncbi:MAG TPA: SGNH/GDSL hydrolase family protein, partial [Opitutus sp.]|nr:SGNH/GDSL hydrolase family protein [Opitutus sp.]
MTFSSLRLLLSSAVFVLALSASHAAGRDGHWVPTWVSAQQLTEPGNMPPAPGLAERSLRQIIQPTLAGTRLRVVISNQYGEKPLVIAGARIARSTGASGIDLSTDRAVTFNGRAGVTVLPGTSMMSDDVTFAVEAFENLAISVHVLDVPEQLTGHPGSRTTSFIQRGDALAQASWPDAQQT